MNSSMDVDESITPGVAYAGRQVETAYVLCADCGTPIEPNGANLCVNCLRNTIDITEGIPKQAIINFCKGCDRYLSPPQHWIIAQLESRELLAICLKKLKSGLSKVRLIDAGFIWTEPHSRRLKVKLTIQKEVFSNTVLQHVFQVEFMVHGAQCPDCTRLAAKNTWRALVQVRQKVDHKRTFLYLEQLILKHNADRDTISVQEVKDGLNFFFATKQHALKMVDFLGSVAPVHTKSSEQLISQDMQNHTSNTKTTLAVEIIPICKDDLVVLPKKLARSMANISPLTVCHRVGNQVYLIDPITLSMGDISATQFWRSPFSPLANITQAIEFMVLDIEPTSYPPVVAKNGRFLLADAQVSPLNGDMSDDAIFHTRTHLGAVLKPGDTVLGYYLTNSNFNHDNFDELDDYPDVVLVRKTYPNRRKKSKARVFKLRSMVKEVGGSSLEGADTIGLGRERGAGGKRAGTVDQAKAEQDYELFLRDIEEDEEIRASVNLFKSSGAKDQAAAAGADTEMADASDADDEADFPEISVDELLDDMEDLTIKDADEGAVAEE